MATETMEQAVTEAVRILREGGVILYPTDTVWGIGCDATNAEAVERIYRLKRSENKKSMAPPRMNQVQLFAFRCSRGISPLCHH